MIILLNISENTAHFSTINKVKYFIFKYFLNQILPMGVHCFSLELNETCFS